MRIRKRHLIVLVLLVACGSGSAGKPRSSAPDAAEVTTSKLSATPLPQAGSELAAIDIFGTRQITLEALLVTHGDELRKFREPTFDRKALLAKIGQLGDFVHVSPSLIGYYKPEGMKYYLTLDFVDRSDASRRMPFLHAPTGTYQDPEGLLADWQTYESKLHELWRSQRMGFSRVPCPAFHCLGDPTHPEVKQLADRFAARAPAHVEDLAAILRDDKNVENRGAAAYLLAYSKDGPALVKILVPAFRDSSSLVRNNSMRVVHDIAAYHPELEVPLEPVLEALDYPDTTDRNKASAILDALLKRPDAARLHCPIATRAGATLLAMLRLQQPNNHDFAYSILKAISGNDFGERDDAAWEAWLSTVPRACQ